MLESFKDFLGKKRMPKETPPEEVYDQHVDAIMHHLHQVHKLTHPTSLIHKSLERLGEKGNHVNELHDHVTDLIKKFGG